MAAEYPAQTNYLYLTYHGEEHDIVFENDDKSVIVLGSGLTELEAVLNLTGVCKCSSYDQKENYRSIMINYNPETVSTDYDICDRLYFDELSFERVMDIVDLENPHGVIVSVGGQIPNNLAMRLYRSECSNFGNIA